LLSIWIRDFGQAESREVPDTTGCYSLFWSPDSKYLYYSVYVGGELRRISMAGGPQDVLAHAPPRFLGAWFHAGEIRSADRENGWAVPFGGGAVRQLPLPQTWAQPLPDSRAIYVAWDEGRNVNQVRLAGPDQAGVTLFESDSRVLLTPSTGNGSLWWLLSMRGPNLVARQFDSRSGRLTAQGPYPLAAHVPYFRSTGAVEASVGANSLVFLDHPDRSQLVWVDRQGRELATVGDVLSTFNHVR
jgi:hypothetical protein